VMWGPKIQKVLENTPRANKEISLGESVIQRLSLNVQLRMRVSMASILWPSQCIDTCGAADERGADASAEFWTLSS
jgi:hypothetical protein